MIALGIGVANLVHPVNNIAWLKENYGDKMIFVGGFDAQKYCAPDTAEEATLGDQYHNPCL